MSIFFTNDFHSNVPNSSRFLNKLTTIKKSKKDILVDVGDFTEGSAFYLQFKGKPELKILSKLYDLAIPGNHGFAEIVEISRRGFYVLNSNIYYNDELLFHESYTHQDINITSVLLGIISPEAFYSIELEKRKNYEVINPLLVLPKLMRKYKQDNTKIIVLSHSGFEYDLNLAKHVAGIDVILSSHCHSKYTKTIVGNTVVIKAKEEGEGYGKLTIKDNNLVAKVYSTPLATGTLKPTLKFLDKKIKEYTQKVSNIILNKDQTKQIRGKNNKEITHDFIQYLQENFNVDLIIVNYNMFRNNLRKDTITQKDLDNYCPFDNSFVITEIDVTKLSQNISKIPEDMKVYIYLSHPLSKLKNKITFLTTSYLTDNFLAHSGLKSYNTGSKVRKIFLDYLINTY